MDQSTVHPPETMTRVSAAPPETVPIWNASVDAECVVPDADLADAKHLVGIKPEKNAIACPELANHLSVNGLPDAAHDHVTIPVMENATEFSAGKGAGLNPGVCFNFEMSYQHRDSHYKETASGPSYPYDRNPHTRKDGFHIETGPCSSTSCVQTDNGVCTPGASTIPVDVSKDKILCVPAVAGQYHPTSGTSRHANRGVGNHSKVKPFECPVCGRQFSIKRSLHNHRRIHMTAKPFECTICGKSFSAKFRLDTHLRLHNGQKPYQCAVCDKSFADRGNLYHHDKIHTGEKPYECTVCGKSFAKKDQLNRHLRIHNGEKPFGCTICGKYFADKGNLGQHKFTHTGEKPFECTLCGKNFTKKDQLNRHLRIHIGEKPHQCTMCEKRFSDKGNLTKHILVHIEDKPFVCTICGKSFIRNSQLNRHMRMHNGDKPYGCTVCGKQFADEGVLRKHCLLHTGKNS